MSGACLRVERDRGDVSFFAFDPGARFHMAPRIYGSCAPQHHLGESLVSGFRRRSGRTGATRGHFPVSSRARPTGPSYPHPEPPSEAGMRLDEPARSAL
jgi:hypothetical protein